MAVSQEIADSTDWLNTPLNGFSGLENALHCQICKEFYETPMITSCSHTFCSKCIRTSLSIDGRCPTCRASDQASKLRNNWALEEAVDSFVRARPAALSAARRERDVVEQSKRPGKRKRTIVDPDNTEMLENGGRTTRSKSRRIASSQASQQEHVEITDSEDDSDIQPETSLDGLVNCPLGCGKRMKIEQVDPHLDRCEDERTQASRSKSHISVNGFGRITQPSRHSFKPQERLAELNYSLLRDQGMRKKLEELGIPASGSKQLMVRRHIEWVNIWNANCDSQHPRTKKELLRDLDIWERTQGGKAPSNSGHMNGFMRKDFDGAEWASKNKDEFSKLIADARRKERNSNNNIPAPCSDLLEKNNGNNSHKPNSPSQPVPSMLKPDSQPYAKNPEALDSVRAKVEALNAGETIAPMMNEGFRVNIGTTESEGPVLLNINTLEDTAEESIAVPGTENPTLLGQSHFGNYSPTIRDEHAVNKNTGTPCDLPTHLQSSSRTVGMFKMPEEPLTDLDGTEHEAQI